MSVHGLAGLQRQARLRTLARITLFALPWAVVAAALQWRLAMLGAWPIAIVGVVAAALATAQWRRRDLDWTARALDARYPSLEDSSHLLVEDSAALSPLANLQRARVADRLRALQPPPRLGPPLFDTALAWSAVLALVLAVLAWWAPMPGMPRPEARAAAPLAATAASAPGLRDLGVRIQPPAYTGLPERVQDRLAARVPEGSRLTWSIATDGPVSEVALRFHDGEVLALSARDGRWTGERVLSRSSLVRLRIEGRELAWQRIDVVPDRAPRVRVIAPDRSLVLVEPGQRTWPLEFQAEDDHGLGPARLAITLAQGSGENIQVSTRQLALTGTGDARKRSYRHSIDLAASGLAPGDDLVVRLAVSDRRAPQAQTTRSASVILRWPPESGAQASGVDGLVQRTLPAYFRSQRQIIMDAEALLAERRKLSADAFTTRSDGIGVDQRILRLRYGQFLGEEAEEPPSAAASPGDAHAEDGEAEPAAEASALVQSFGHTHDEAEAATLLDPPTRKLLKSALDAMWASERELRQGRPREALPHAYRALRFIKQVQQASRIYLARVGLELAPVDPARRLSGKREGIAPARARLPAANDDAAPARAFWQVLGEGAKARPQQLRAAVAFEHWLHRQDVEDLSLVMALDAWREDDACRDCLDQLRAALWPLLPPAPAAVPARVRADARGQTYLRALSTEPRP